MSKSAAGAKYIGALASETSILKIIAPIMPNSSRPIRKIAKDNSAPGLPGYRIRQGRTGYDPIENIQEGAYLQGKFLRLLLTGRLRTRRPVYLWLMGLSGISLLAPLVLYGTSYLQRKWELDATQWLCGMLPLAVLGLGLLVNFILSLVTNKRG